MQPLAIALNQRFWKEEKKKKKKWDWKCENNMQIKAFQLKQMRDLNDLPSAH